MSIEQIKTNLIAAKNILDEIAAEDLYFKIADGDPLGIAIDSISRFEEMIKLSEN